MTQQQTGGGGGDDNDDDKKSSVSMPLDAAVETTDSHEIGTHSIFRAP